MKKSLVLLILLCAVTAAYARPRVVIDRSNLKTDSAQAVESMPGRLILDPTEYAYQLKEDSVNAITEAKIRDLIIRLEKNFNNPEVEEEVGRLIGEAVMEGQMALLELQIDRSISIRDTLLTKALQIALRELVTKNAFLQHQLEEGIEYLENEADRK